MKTIRTANGQIFEILTSRKELGNYINDIADKRYVNSTDDCVYYWLTKDGLSHWDGIPNISQISIFVEDNGTTKVLYGKINIVYNEHYDDYDIEY